MPAFVKIDNNLSTGIPARQIGPETGSSGNATMTNRGDTSEGTNESHDSVPAPAAGFEAPILGEDYDGESRSFAPSRLSGQDGEIGDFDPNVESPAQQVADGASRIKRNDDIER
jgi:hypothetical protein